MTAKFVMLVLVAFSLAACETATTSDLSMRRGASPTRGDLGHHKVQIRGPVVPDRASAAHVANVAPVRRAQGVPVRHPHGVREVPNPMRADATGTSAATTATTDTNTQAQVPVSPTEPVQQASVTDPPAELPSGPVFGAYPADDPTTLPISEPSPLPAPTTLSLWGVTPDVIEQMFGGMPFWLIAVIATALVATFGLALRRPRRERAEYVERVDPEEDYREPYAA